MRLKDEIYKKGYTIESFANESGISRYTLMNIFNKKQNPRGHTIYIIADTLNLPYDEVKRIIYDTRANK